MSTTLLSPITTTVCPADGVGAASHFLHNWFAGCEGLVELRHGQRTPDGEQIINVWSEWFSIDKLESLARHAVKISSEGREAYFGVSIATLRKWVHERRVPFIKLANGSLVRFRQRDLDRLILNGPVEPRQGKEGGE